MLQRLDRRRRRGDDVAVELGHLGLDPVAGILGGGAGVDGAAHRREQLLDRPERHAFGDPLKPAVAGQQPRRLDRHLERQRPRLVIGGDVGQPGREPAAPAARLALRADDPAPQLDRLLPGQRRGEGRIGGLEQMVALVEDDPGRRHCPPSRPRAALTITSAWLAMTMSASWLARAERSMKHFR